MPLDQALLDQITTELRADEGVRRFAYDDATSRAVLLPTGGKLTIGVGRNLTDRGISDDEVNYLLANDLRLVYQAALQVFPTFDSFSQNRRSALLNLLFNLGPGTFVTFKTTIKAVRDGRWDDAADALVNSRWYRQVQASRKERIVNQIRNG